MQLYAWDVNRRLTSASKAQKHQDYFCVECQGIIRLRGGLHRQKHFYHLKPDFSCRLSGKSMAHLQIQCFLQNHFPDCHLEIKFPEINRIADVVWDSQKLIFEIQCSGISAEEVKQRNCDYKRMGYQVVWILHDNFYNQRRLTAAELFLRGSPFYFTSMDAYGSGIFYDQLDVIHKGLRRYIQTPLTVDLRFPKTVVKDLINSQHPPQFLRQRIEQWPLSFKGDLMDSYGSYDVSEALLAEQQWLFAKTPHQSFLKRMWKWFIVRPYRLSFQMLLEKLCR
jgi:competence protein CoiA